MNSYSPVIPAKAGIHTPCPFDWLRRMGPRFRGDDGFVTASDNRCRRDCTLFVRFVAEKAANASNRCSSRFAYLFGKPRDASKSGINDCNKPRLLHETVPAGRAEPR